MILNYGEQLTGKGNSMLRKMLDIYHHTVSLKNTMKTTSTHPSSWSYQSTTSILMSMSLS